MQESGSKSQDTRSAILDAAIELFIRAGFEKTPMDEIASAAGVAKGTLYYHFSSKEGIVDSIVERYTAALEARLAAVVSNAGLDLVEKFGEASSAIGEINSVHFAKLHRMKYIDINHKTLQAMVGHCAPYLAGIIEEGNAKGLCAVEFPVEFAEIMLAASQYLLDPEYGAENLPRRIKALARLSALVLGMDAEDLERIYGKAAEDDAAPRAGIPGGGRNEE
jgi:AcrR family transcriptional regulator